ncbi:hypothetical protein FRC07_002709 [Ceratobasidium sp. 392]|nr:hypothetical protein FRC07_002709 [Ceratobasidium sp. 392]
MCEDGKTAVFSMSSPRIAENLLSRLITPHAAIIPAAPMATVAILNISRSAVPLVRSSSLNTTIERPSSAFGSLLGLGPASSLLGIGLNAFDRAYTSQPPTRVRTPIPRAPSPSPTHIGIPSRHSIAPHPATVLAPSAGLGSSFGSNALGTSFGSMTAIGTNGVGGLGSGANTPSYSLFRTLPPPGNEYSGTGWRVASPLPTHISSELAPPGGSVPGSPLALAPGSPLANAFTNEGFFGSAPTSAVNTTPEPDLHDEPKFGMGLGLTGAGMHIESDGEDLLPTMSYEDFVDGFATDAESPADPDEKERPRGYRTLPCKFFNPLLGRDCPAGDACNFIHDKLFSNKFNAAPLATNGNSGGSSTSTRRDSINNPTHPLFRTRECKYWAAGRCNQGDDCPFKHTYGEDVEHQFDSAGSGEGSRDNPYWRTRRTARPCKWSQQGQCLRGDNCNHLHTLETTPVVCKFYPTPGCRNGNECPCVHADLDEDMWAEEQEGAGQDLNGGFHVNENGNGIAGVNGNGGFHPEDEDSEDDVIFEPMRAAGGAQGSGKLIMLLSGLALSVAFFVAATTIASSVPYKSVQTNNWAVNRRQEMMGFVANRAGLISFALIPLTILLSARNNLLLRLTGWSMTTMITLHQWVARMCAFQAVVHSVGWTVEWYWDMGNWSEFMSEGAMPYIQWEPRLVKPGTHYFVYLPALQTWKPWENHPFSIASWIISEANGGSSHASDEGSTSKGSDIEKAQNKGQFTSQSCITMLVKPHSGATQALLDYVLTTGAAASIPVLLEGPYGEPHPLHLYENVVLVSGGIGVTPVLAYAQDLNSHGRHVTLIWASRDSELIKAVRHMLPEYVDAQIYYTGAHGKGTSGDMPSLRPDARKVVRDYAHMDRAGRTAFFVCGPPEMVDQVRTACVDCLGNDVPADKIGFFEESFAW